MATKKLSLALGWLAGTVGLALASYAGYVALAWARYGHGVRPGSGDESDELLDRFMPVYEVVERHHICVNAPADVTFAAAMEMDMRQSRIVRGIFEGRELILGARPDDQQRPRGLVALTKELGWGVLALVPGREIVLGAVTQPWKADVVFRAVAPDEFAAFNQPDLVKIIWNLRADPVSGDRSVFRAETRVTTTDATARDKFRWYWSRFSPGIVLIRWVSLGLVKTEAERRARAHTLSKVG